MGPVSPAMAGPVDGSFVSYILWLHYVIVYDEAKDAALVEWLMNKVANN